MNVLLLPNLITGRSKQKEIVKISVSYNSFSINKKVKAITQSAGVAFRWMDQVDFQMWRIPTDLINIHTHLKICKTSCDEINPIHN